MTVSRRKFLQLSGVVTGAAMLPGSLVSARQDEAEFTLHKQIGETLTICPYCAVGCGMVVGASKGKVINIEGDPDHPINRGSLCSKGGTLTGLVNSPQRISKPAYRAPGATEWQEVEWDWALNEVAQRVKQTRDKYWIERDEQGRTVRRVEAIAAVGSAALDNEECSLLIKALRAMGLVYVEHQARI